jgi:3-oxoadipate enol-lactonase
MARRTALDMLGRVLRAAPVPAIPPGRIIELPGRGSTYLVDTGEPPRGPGAAQHAGEIAAAGPQTVVLLHALACTGLLTWYPCLDELRRRYRVIIYDQRWHGQGIKDGPFRLADCADDVAAVADALGIDRFVLAGYSMGTLVGQLAWRRHPDRVAGLVLCAGATHFADEPRRQDAVRRAGRRLTAAAERQRRLTAEVLDQTVDEGWAWRQFRSTSGSAVTGAAAVIARFDSRPWIGEVDVPAAVVVTARDRLVLPSRQRAMARAIPGATSYEVAAGHASCVLGADRFRPALLAATASVSSRIGVPR